MGKDAPPASTDKPAQKLVDPGLADAVANLSSEDAAKVLELLEKALKRRKIQVWGYLVAAVVLIVGFVGALYWYGLQPEGTFVGWVVMIPLGLCGVVLFTFGKWSERYHTDVEKRFAAQQRAKKP